MNKEQLKEINLEVIIQQDQATLKPLFTVALVKPLSNNRFLAFIEKSFNLHVIEQRTFNTERGMKDYISRIKMKQEMGSDNFFHV